MSKIKTTIKALIKKGVVTKQNRTRKDGGKSSNLYTLNDCKELWSKKEAKKESIADTKKEAFSLAEIPLEELEKEINRRKNELALQTPTTVQEETSPNKNNMSNNSFDIPAEGQYNAEADRECDHEVSDCWIGPSI